MKNCPNSIFCSIIFVTNSKFLLTVLTKQDLTAVTNY